MVPFVVFISKCGTYQYMDAVVVSRGRDCVIHMAHLVTCMMKLQWRGSEMGGGGVGGGGAKKYSSQAGGGYGRGMGEGGERCTYLPSLQSVGAFVEKYVYMLYLVTNCL